MKKVEDAPIEHSADAKSVDEAPDAGNYRQALR